MDFEEVRFSEPIKFNFLIYVSFILGMNTDSKLINARF